MTRVDVGLDGPGELRRTCAAGEVAVQVAELRLLDRATRPPFAIEEETDADESARLRHPIDELRRAPRQRALRLRQDLFMNAPSPVAGDQLEELLHRVSRGRPKP